MDKLNPGIVKTVAWLRSNGFDTCDSGDGQTHDYECDRDYPYVVMEVAPERMVDEARRLYGLLKGMGVPMQSVGPTNECQAVQASFDPDNGRAFIDLMGVDDAMLAKCGKVPV